MQLKRISLLELLGYLTLLSVVATIMAAIYGWMVGAWMLFRWSGVVALTMVISAAVTEVAPEITRFAVSVLMVLAAGVAILGSFETIELCYRGLIEWVPVGSLILIAATSTVVFGTLSVLFLCLYRELAEL